MPPSRTPMNLLALSEDQMKAFARKHGWPDYRTGQILRWIYRRRVRAIDQMTDLSICDRSILAEHAVIQRAAHSRILASRDGTRKFLLTFDDGMTTEAILIPDDERLTLCVSTQIGCMLDCGFCLTGTMGLKRNLKAHEIVEQVLSAQDHVSADEQITNLVFMGMGEPLSNCDALETAITCLTNKSWGLGWSPRRIVVSTAGLVTRMQKVAALGVNLAISLNATTEEQRRALMPAASDIASLKSLFAACRRLPLTPNRRLTFEYVLLAGVNDQPADAQRLTTLLKALRCKVNLIPFNEFPGSRFRRPSEHVILQFQDTLRRAGIDAFVRKSRGRDILGACGQLGQLPGDHEHVSLLPIESRC